MIKIRPHHLLDMIPQNERLASIVLPNKHSAMYAVETVCHIALLKLIKPKVVFEIGTYLGEQSITLAANLEDGGIVYTLDLLTSQIDEIDFHPCDEPVARRRVCLPKPVVSDEIQERIVYLYGDSNKFDFSPYIDKVQFVIIDGGHDIRTISSDTENAFRMLDKNRAGCIIWDDYNNPNYDITEFIDELSKRLSLYYIEDTMSVFYLRNIEI